MFTITVTRGEDQGRKLELTPGKTFTIGCDEGDSLVLRDPKVLPGHCAVAVDGDSVILKNQTASAGTFVGEKKISQARLRGRIAFRIGDTTLLVAPTPKEAPAQAGGTRPTKRRRVSQDDPLIGKIIGGYKMIEVVGRGGMGTVYRATQLSLDRDVALKVLAPQLAKDRSFVDLFVHEARAAAQLVHPNVVQVYDAGTEGDVSFFSMEFIGQGSVEEILEADEKIPWEQAILMVLEAAHGLEYAEGKGIVHRDIKPDNLMLNDDGRVKIADLGLAKRGEGKKDTGVIGTPHFIPPEQAMGKEVDTRADIYSLGATFFRMITGQTLYSGKTAKEIVLKHIKEPPPAASSIDSGIPGDLELVLAKMLAKDPGQRYQTARELISALEEVCAHHGIKGSIIRKGVGKRVLIPVIALLLVAASIAIYFAFIKEPVFREDTAAREAAEKARREREAALAEAAAKERDNRRLAANIEWGELDNKEYKIQAENPIESVYDSETKAPEREGRWLNYLGELERYSKSETAELFEEESQLSSKAANKAKRLRKKLENIKLAVNDKREWVTGEETAAKTIAEQQKLAYQALVRERHYEKAWEFCERLSREKPAKDDPFAEIENAVWTSPIDPDTKQRASNIPEIMEVIQKSRGYFREEKDLIAKNAENDWAAVQRRLPKESELDAATDEQLEEALTELETVVDRFGGNRVEEIREIVGAARRRKETIEKTLEMRQTERLEADRELIKRALRNVRCLDPGAAPNYVMDCDFTQAIATWTEQLEKVQTKRYRGFVQERIQMLRWADYLFWRFRSDLVATLGGQEVFRSLDSEWPGDDGGRPTSFKFTKPDGDDIYVYEASKKFRGESLIPFKRMTMDWVYAYAFHTPEGELRWKETPPVVEFALAAWCYETMQFEKSLKHFTRLRDDPRYGKAAGYFASRAKLEAAARKEYEEILDAYGKSRQGKAEAVRQVLERLHNFPKMHAGTLFYIEVMPPGDKVTEDFYNGEAVPVPEAPPKTE